MGAPYPCVGSVEVKVTTSWGWMGEDTILPEHSLKLSELEAKPYMSLRFKLKALYRLLRNKFHGAVGEFYR